MELLFFSKRSPTSCSNLEREIFISRCLGPVASAVIKGKLISVSVAVESSILALSAASFNLWRAILSFFRSMPWSFLNSPTIQSSILRSKSSPPRNVSPFVDLTSITPSPISSIEYQKSRLQGHTQLLFLPSSCPCRRQALLRWGSLMILRTFSPAILPASFVACLWLSSKYAGTVITASVTFSPR